MKHVVIIFTAISLLPCLSFSQGIDTTAINASWLRAHSIHEDSAQVARQLCLTVLAQSIKAEYLRGQGDALLTLGVISRNEDDFSQSYNYLNQSLKIRRLLGDSNRIAAVYINLGINMLEESKYDSAIAMVTYAIRIVESLPNPDYAVLGSEYLLLSNIYDEYVEAEEALKCAKKSLVFYQKNGSEELVSKALYALANRFLGIGERDSAMTYYNQAFVRFAHTTRDPSYLSNIMINRGIIYTDWRDYSRAEDQYRQAQHLMDSTGNREDYFHLYLNKAQWAMAQDDWKGGLDLLKKALPNDISELDFLDRLYLFENLSDVYAHFQLYDTAYYYQNAAYAVRDSIYNENKRKEFIRFQTERYKRETAQQALATQQEASRARLFLLSSVLLLILALLIGYAYYQRKKAFRLIQLQQEKLHRQEVDDLIQTSELRYLSAGLEGRETEREQIARELHDQLGSSVVTLSWQYDAILENTTHDSGNYETLLKLNDSLKRLYQDIRQIAHQLGSGVLERAGLIPVLNELCQHIESGNRMEVSFSQFGMDDRLGFTYEVNILRIIQELISNVLKYAKATQLMIQINRIDEVVNIMVEDNGTGFDQKAALQRSGAGLANIEARLRSLSGTIQFENRPLGGTTVIINIPLPKPESFYEQTY